MKYFLTGMNVLFVAALLLPSFVFAQDCSLETKKAYKAPDSSSVYYVTDSCTKKAFRKSKIFFSYFDSWDDVEVVNQSRLDAISNDQVKFIAWGPKYEPGQGAIVKTLNDPKVYFLLEGKKYWVNSESSFNALGFKGNWIEDVSHELLSQYPDGGEINSNDGHPNYTILKYEGKPEVYRLEPHPKDSRKTVRRHIVSPELFKDLGYRTDRIIEVPDNSSDDIDDTDDSDNDSSEFSFSFGTTVDTLSETMEGRPIFSSLDVRTIEVEDGTYEEDGYNEEYTKMHEPLFDLTFEVPDTFERQYSNVSQKGDVYTLNYEDEDFSLSFDIVENELGLSQKHANVLLEGIFTAPAEGETGYEQHVDRLTKDFFEIFGVDSFDELTQEQKDYIGETVLGFFLIQMFLPEGEIVTDAVFGDHKNIFQYAVEVEEDNDTYYSSIYIVYTPEFSYTITISSEENLETSEEVQYILSHIEID